MTSIKNEVLSNLFRSTTNLMAFEQFLSSLPFNIAQRQDSPQPSRAPAGPLPRREAFNAVSNEEIQSNGEELQLVIPSARREGPKVGRNDPCPCGSGKKYKNCCGRTA
jgi:preprotein translocase subunit SecA